MTDMVKKAARELAKAAHNRADHLSGEDYERFINLVAPSYEASVIIVLNSMREPSDRMRMAVSAQWGHRTWSQYDDVITAAIGRIPE